MRFLILVSIFFLVGCSNSNKKSQVKLDGEVLIEKKCSMCHNLDMPPKSYDNEKAPSMMAVTFHLKDFIKSTNPAEHETKIADFIKDYVINPSASKSFCDKKSLEDYGVMPSQKGKVTQEELEAIAQYMYRTYDNQKLLEIMQEQNRLAKLPIYERVFEKNRCRYCHNNKKLAPTFQDIAKRYTQKDKKILMDSIKNGSKGKWKGFSMPMPPHKKIDNKELQGVVDYILSLKSSKI